MYIKEIIISNYRSCQIINLNLSENSPNIFIGLNDSGKSTILQSLELLFGNRPQYNSLGEGNYKSDLSNSSIKVEELNKLLLEKKLPPLDISEKSTTIIGKLMYESEELIEFSELNLTNPLLWSIESNADKEFWLVKNYYENKTQTYLIANEWETPLELWSTNQATLNKKIKEFGVTNEDIENENKKGRFSNLEKVRAIYSKQECKKIWFEYKPGRSDKEIFPSFNLFDWNTSLDEIVSTANVIMQEEINEHLKPIKDLADEKALKAEKAINKKFGDMSDIIKEVAKDVEGISSKVYFDVKEKISDIMVTKIHSDGPIHLENQGEGLKRQIWFSLVKAKADSDKEGFNKFIWAFDEPETHLYPGAQREFFDILQSISSGNVQTLISTHSTIFTDKSNLNKINSVKQNNGYTEINYCKDIESIFSSLNVKNSDFLFYDNFLVVEGDTEQYLIPKLYELYTGNTLIYDNIQLLNIQGKNKWVTNKQIIDKILGDFKKSDEHVIYLFDNDMSFEIGEAAKSENMFFVGSQDIEDSIDNEIWLEILNKFYDGLLTFSEEEIFEWKDKVVKNAKCHDYEKFYPILKKGIKAKSKEAKVEYESLKRLPSKGNDSAELILKHLTDKNQIPSVITDAFNKIKS